MIKKVLTFIYFSVLVFALTLFIFSCVNSRVSLVARELISPPVRSFYAYFTNFIDASVFEILLIVLVILIPFLVYRVILGRGRLMPLLLILSFFAFGYIFSIGINATAKGREGREITGGEYIASLEYITDKLDMLASEELPGGEEAIKFDEKIALKIADELEIAIPKAKASIFPSLLTRLGILSYYSPFTMEIVINDEAPSFIKTFSLYHELMHYLGIVREDEASFLSFKLLSNEENREYVYSAYLFAYVLVGARVYQLSADDYSSFYEKLPPRVKKDLKNRDDFLEKEEKLHIGDKLNDTAVGMVDNRRGASYCDAAALIAEYILYGVD